MLLLKLRPGGTVWIGDGVTLLVRSVTDGKLRLGIEAPGLRITFDAGIAPDPSAGEAEDGRGAQDVG